jgi:hypothetical protein
VSRRAGGLVVLLALVACGSPSTQTPSPSPSPTPSYCDTAPSAYAIAVTDWWLPNCSVAQNIYNDPQLALGPPDAAGYGPDHYSGFVSLGFGGFVTLDLGGCISDVQGPDVRVFQAVSSEALGVWVAEAPEGPYTLLSPRVPCGGRVGPVIKYCDFDFAAAGVARARFIKVRDGEYYPCPGDTVTEGADLDAIQALAVPIR